MESLLSPPVFVALYGALLLAYLGLRRRLQAPRARSPALALSRSTREGVRLLLGDLRGSDQDLRRVAARRLAEPSGRERAAVLRFLEDPDDREGCRLAIEAAAELGLREAVPLLGRLLGNREPSLSEAAAQSLGRIGDDESLRWLEASSARLDEELGRAHAAHAAPQTPSPPLAAVPAVAPHVPSSPSSPPPPPLSRVLEPLNANACRALDRYTHRDLRALDEGGVIDVLLAAARDPAAAPANRYAAVRSLAGFRRPGLAAEVAPLLGDEVPVVRYATADTLATLGGAPAAGALLQGLRDGNPFVRSAAAAGLARLGDDRALVPLMELRQDGDEIVRTTAEAALRDLARRKDVGALLLRARPPAVTPGGETPRAGAPARPPSGSGTRRG